VNILAAILILGATGHAERSMESADSIAGIVAQCVHGAWDDGKLRGRIRAAGMVGSAFEVPDVQLTIDGQSRTDLRSWGEAAWRVGGYVADSRDDGSVGLAYRLRVHRFDIATTTSVSDGSVVKRIDAWWTEVVVIPVPCFLRWLLGEQIVRRIPVHVSISIRADETSSESTRIVGTATGTADTSDFHCRGVRLRIAEPQATASLNAGLRDALATIERRGRLAYAGGAEIADVLDGINLGIKIAGRIRR